ncbi:MAG: M28 family peptidase [Cyclobacteriaceae bacterium]|nr:M28 family peptidase [Cyclobacteriaceae bacterium]
MRNLLTLIFILLGESIIGQNISPKQHVASIDVNDIKQCIAVLTSREFEGREAGEKGGRKTASYIKKTFEMLGVLPVVDSADTKSFYQKIPLRGKKYSFNVVGLIKGSESPDEVIIITAHYDHLGIKGKDYYPGADDNASGVSALLEIAQAFAEAKKKGEAPKRSILFIALAAEEKGLIGSQYYVDKDPIFPLGQTVVNLNMDMIGHLDGLHPKNPNFVSIVGSDWQSTDLHNIHEKANTDYVGLELDYTYNAFNHPEMFFYRSDQYNFARHGIPVIFYTSGDHKDYHKPTDTIENIEFERIQKVAQLVFYTAWEIANKKERIIVDKQLN